MTWHAFTAALKSWVIMAYFRSVTIYWIAAIDKQYTLRQREGWGEGQTDRQRRTERAK